MKLSNTSIKFLSIFGAIALSLVLIPLLFKGIVATSAVLGVALILAAVFVFGMLVAVALLSPFWIPFLAGWAAVRFCKKYYNNPPVISEKKETA